MSDPAPSAVTAPPHATLEQPLRFGQVTLRSRLVLGTGKYPSHEVMRAAHEASGTSMVTVAVRRVDFSQKTTLLDFIDRTKIALLPNTAGCYTAAEAIRAAHLGREACGTDLVKLEVIGCTKTLMPDNEATLEAARELIREGFVVLPYVTDDLVLAKKLEQAGCAAVMPLGAPIGSGLGIRNPLQIALIKEAVTIPVIVDAGVGTASDVAIAMELGVDGVLLNTAVAEAGSPARMARAMRLACEAGREAFLAGRMPRRRYASASSPQAGLVEPLALVARATAEPAAGTTAAAPR